MPLRTNTYSRAFTIVELLVIIVVIAILVGISIIGYGAWRKDVSARAVESDLVNLKAAMESAKNWQNGYPVIPGGTQFDGNSTTSGIYVQSEGSVITYYAGDGKSYCVEATSSLAQDVYYYYDSSEGGEPKKGNCQFGENYDPNTPTSYALTAATNYSPRAMTVDPATGDLYFASSSTIYKFTKSTEQFSTIAAGFETDAIEFGGDGKLYVFSASPGGDPGPTYVQSVDIATGTRVNVSATTINRGRSLFKTGNTLYAAGRERVFSYNITTGVATELHYNGSNIYSEGIVAIGSDLYFLRTQGNIAKMSTSGGAVTTYATIPKDASVSGSSVGIDLVFYNGSLYTFGSANGSFSLYKYNMTTNVWSVVIANIRPQVAGCVYPNAFTIHAGRALFVSAQPSDWTTCSPAATAKKLYNSPV